MTSAIINSRVQAKIWEGQLPLEIRLAKSECRTFDDSDPYLVGQPCILRYPCCASFRPSGPCLNPKPEVSFRHITLGKHSFITQISFSRLSYLPLLLTRLHAFFSPYFIADATTVSPHDGFFTYDSVPLKWHLPLGLLYDIYALSSTDTTPEAKPTKALPFRLTLHFSTDSASTNNQPLNLIFPTPPVLLDSFINSVKEADFLRSGTAKPIMSLSTADSESLWYSTQTIDLQSFARIYSSLLPPPGQFRNIPMRVYIPSSSVNQAQDDGQDKQAQTQAQIKVLQSHMPPFVTTSHSSTVPPRAPTSQIPQTLGTALHTMLPRLFPSRRTPILARPILHGAPVPMSAHLEELARYACYADGWLGIVVVLNS